MTDTNSKVDSRTARRGPDGQIYLAAGTSTSMRMWRDEAPGDAKPASTRDYETVGFVVRGRAELHLGGAVVTLAEGDSWTVPRGASHTYKILESFTAIEATTPPARSEGRDA